MSSEISEIEAIPQQNDEGKLILACQVPESATPGSSFHVQLGDRFFEVVTPEGATPGQTINIIVPSTQQVLVVESDAQQESVMDSLLTLGGRAIAHAKNLDEQFKITEKFGEIATPAMEKLRVVDEKYQISQKASAVGVAAQAKLMEIDGKYDISTRTSAVVSASLQRMRDIDEANRLSEIARSAGGTLVAYAREIDARFAVSATAARIVDVGRNALVTGFNKAVEIDQAHHLSERAASLIASGASIVANQVSRLSSPAEEPPLVVAATAAAPAEKVL